MRSPHPTRVIAALGIAITVVIGVALVTSRSPIFTANAPVITHPSLRIITTPPPTTPPPLPSRPSNLSLSRLTPCSVLTKAQRTSLSLDDTPTPYQDPEFDKASACSIRGLSSGTVVRLAFVMNMGIDVWRSETAQVDTTPITVSGYPALVVRTPGLNSLCNVEIDTSDNQFLDVQFRDGGNTPPIPQDTLCLGAQRVADAAVTSLQTHS